MYVQGVRMVGLRGWMTVWCRRCSISPNVTSTDWCLYCHASSLSVLCIRGHLSPLHEASRSSGMLWSSLITWVHSQYCTIIYHKELLEMNIMYIMSISYITTIILKCHFKRDKMCNNDTFLELLFNHYLIFFHNMDIKIKLVFNQKSFLFIW